MELIRVFGQAAFIGLSCYKALIEEAEIKRFPLVSSTQ